MLENISISSILFLDIETVPAHKTYDDLSDEMKYFWAAKAKSILRIYDRELEEQEVIDCYDRAGIYAEFGLIVCISVGFVSQKDGKLSMRVKSYADKDEKVLLEGFAQLLNQYYKNPAKDFICGHNIKEFDIPYICRRMVLNGMRLPYLLDIAGKKPWELNYLLDTLTLWKFGDYKAYTKLSLLTQIFGIPTPKDDIDGSEVGRVFWEEDDLERIAVYCEKDVIATAKLMMKFKLMEIPDDMPVERAGE